jgi:hypothetical protein
LFVEGHAPRSGEKRGVCHASVAGEGAAARNGGDDVRRGIDAANASVRSIFDEEISGGIERQRVGQLDAGIRRDVAVAAAVFAVAMKSAMLPLDGVKRSTRRWQGSAT